MAESPQHIHDPKRTVVVSNFPSDVGEDELTIHFQKEKNGGGDVDEVVMDGNIAFVIFDLPEVVTSVLNQPEQVIDNTKINVQSYQLWLANKKRQKKAISPPVDSPDNSNAENAVRDDAIKTIYVSGIKDSTTKDAITYFFENKKRTGGGDLCEGKEGFKKLSDTVARLTFVSSKDAMGVLEKAKETLLQLEGNTLTVSSVFVPTHDQSILLAKNLNPKTNKETFKNFVESTKNADVFNVVFGKDGNAVVILKSAIDADEDNPEKENAEMKLDESVISLEFAPLVKGIKVSNIPPDTSSDDIKFKFANQKIGGGKVTDIILDRNNGVARVYFEKSSVVSDLVKKKHTFKHIPLTVIPYYDDFEELEEKKTETSDYAGDYSVDPLVMDYIMNTQEIEKKFDFKSMKFDEQTSRFHFKKQFKDANEATVFTNKLKDFLQLFAKEQVKIPKTVFKKVKEEIESKSDECEEDKVEFKFDGSRVTLVGKKEDIVLKKQSIETAIDRISEEAKFVSEDLIIDDKNKLSFLNFINYFKNVMKEFSGVQIHGMESSSGKLSILGIAEKIKDVKLKILQDTMGISEISVKTSVHQMDFLRRTQCKIVNDELKKDDAMLLLINVEGAVGAKALQAKIMTLKKCDDNEKKRLLKIVDTNTSEKCIKVDEETAKFLTSSNKVQEFKKEQFDKHQVLINPELADPCNIWIVCEKSNISNAEKELTSLTDEKTIGSSTFKPMDAMKVRFLREHRWSVIKEKEKSYEGEGVTVNKDDGANSFEIKGTKAGRASMIMYLEGLAGNVNCKTYPLNEPGMKKQMSMDATDLMISDVERNHKCVIQKGVPSEKTEKKTEAPTFVADGGSVAGTSGASTMNLPYQSMSFVNDKEVKLASGQRITIVVGDLAQETVDVIVNTTNEKVDLNANPCGKALLKVAGKELLNECKKVGSLQEGEMASTGSANLNCQRVYHVRSSSWDSGKGTPILRQIIQKCLDQLDKDKLTSIAIPAIGTGNLHFPRPEVAKVFFEEVTSYITTHPQSGIDDVRFVAYGKDKATVDAFLGAVQEIKSTILSPASKATPVAAPGPAPVPLPRKHVIPTPSQDTGLGNVTTSDKPDGSLEFVLSGNVTVQIVCDDISKETTDLIMHVTSQDFSFNGGVGKALIKAGGKTIEQECKGLGQPGLFSTQYTNAGNLSVNQIAHVIGSGKSSYADLKKCLEIFFDDISQKNIAKVSFSAIGAGAMGYSESQSADLIFDNLFRIAQSKNPALSLVRIVIFEKAKFIKFKDAAKDYVANGGPTSSSATAKKSSYVPKLSFNVFRSKKQPGKTTVEEEGIFFKIYCDDRGRLDKAWGELNGRMKKNIKVKTMSEDIIKKFTDSELEMFRKLERDFDFEIKVDKSKGDIKLKGHIYDIASVQDKINEILNEVKDKESKVPAYWTKKPDDRVFHKFPLTTGSKEYKDVEAAFRATVPNQIVSIERIQNEEIYGLFNLKRQAMMKKYGANFATKEKMLFHGTSKENLEKINAGGLNRSFAGIHATAFGRGVYFARDASYSCRQTYSPPDPQGLRYMYYARVLIGDYTNGNSSMIVAPNKNSSDPNETYDSVVDDVANPSMYILFQDYEYYNEYLITFM